MSTRPQWFVRGDIDGFFALFLDNLLQLVVIATLGVFVAQLPASLIIETILPGCAVSILVGNLFYSWQAWKLAKKEGRDTVTALPYGINTPSLFAYIFLVMAPVYHGSVGELGEEAAARLTWQIGLAACFLSGLIELAGCVVGPWLRRNTPRAALLSALAGIAITFIAMGFIFQIFALPLIAFIPMILILVGYASGIRWPLDIPVGLIAITLGIILAWGGRALGFTDWEPTNFPVTNESWLYLPHLTIGETFAVLVDPQALKYLAVIIPMGLFNLIGSLQNLESAEAAGDKFETAPSLAANGIGTLIAACFGSPFPTTIYIGHPGWKMMGARIGYSALNGVIIAALCLSGAIIPVLYLVPIEATLGILLWIGVIITAQAFQDVPREHAPAVAVGLVPPLAAYVFFVIQTTVGAAGTTLPETLAGFAQSKFYIEGVFALNQGYLLTSMIFAATLAYVIDRKFLHAAAWLVAGALLSAVGFIHAYKVLDFGLETIIGFVKEEGGWLAGYNLAAPEYTVCYLTAAVLLTGLHFYHAGKADSGKPDDSGAPSDSSSDGENLTHAND